VTGNQAGICTSASLVTDSVFIDAGGNSGGIDFWFVELGDEGCTPGYWKNHAKSWVGTGFTTGQSLESVFDVPDALGLDNKTLLQALKFGGGAGVGGAAQILLRASVASLLNSAHAGVDFPRTTGEVIGAVNAALASGNRATMLALATSLDNDNNGGCRLN
jgi:hypothetical protein